MKGLYLYSALLAVINFPFVMAVETYSKRRQLKAVFRVEAPSSQRRREIRNSLLTTPIHAILFFAFFKWELIQVTPDNPLLIFASFLITLLWTEVWHYSSHVAFHLRALHFIHREHHQSHLTCPWTAVSFSVLEKLVFSAGILAGLACFSRVQPLSSLGVFLYYVVYFFTNVLGHSNIEFRQPGYYGTFLGKIFNSPTYHALHHARYFKNYGLLTPWLDNLFGTAWPDTAAVQSRVAKGMPLDRLGQRVDATLPES